MSKQPFISVVIPCYNDGTYLPETIDKIKSQTYTHFEIIVVNDGSTDEFTLNVLKEIEIQGVTVLHKQNGRMSSARNHGVKHAKGEIIAAVDSDDYFDFSFFQKAVAIFESEPQTAVVSSYIKMFGESNSKSKPRGGNQYNFLFSNECSACAMVRKSCWDQIGGYDEEMKMGYEDWEFYIRITQKGWNIHIIPEYLNFYRQTKKSTRKTQTEPNRKKIIEYILSKHRDWYLSCLADLINEKKVLFTERRTAYATIFKLLSDRITGKYS